LIDAGAGRRLNKIKRKAPNTRKGLQSQMIWMPQEKKVLLNPHPGVAFLAICLKPLPAFSGAAS
jgi:hypothetical protein